MNAPTITDITTIATAPSGIPLLVVRVDTSEDGLYGLGCATFAWRWSAVREVIESYLRPILIGRPVTAIRDTFHLAHRNAYWRSGPVLNNAVSGVDMALWDIAGKRAGMPCCDLWGGAVRNSVDVYTHANGRSVEELRDSVARLAAEGYRFIRCQLAGYGPPAGDTAGDAAAATGAASIISPSDRIDSIVDMFERIIPDLPDGVRPLHDVHERLHPTDAMRLAERLDRFDLFFLEDLFAPESIDWFRRARERLQTPLSMGELFCSPAELNPLIDEGLIDYIRVHPSFYGGITPCLDLATRCEAKDIRTAWHGPGDLSPVGAAANIHMDFAAPNFGIQEWVVRSEIEYEMFPGLPAPHNGRIDPPAASGLGVDIDMRVAERFPAAVEATRWTHTRFDDGGLTCP